MDTIRLTFDTENDIVTLETADTTLEADFPPREEYDFETGAKVSVIVSAMMHALSLDPNTSNEEKDLWWRLDVNPEDILNYDKKESDWDTTFSFTFVGKNPRKKQDGCIQHVYIDDERGDVLAFSGIPPEDEWDDDYERVHRTSRDPFFRPGWELGFTMKESLKLGYKAIDYWMVRPTTGPDSGQWKLEFRLPTVWKRPPLQPLGWH
ncbi:MULTISPECIES: hypothetical protein [Actinotignum]|uniref:hypothetical protein n=2 Tax=Actinomycetaceae TaxID=2049 RepID=UPI00254E82B6|nr:MULTISPECIES: hypothetical protein [Actinotignum]MDE1535972.1 hypothetical protein [Actinotignum schaalii]MDK7271739.1 hypothetical protein [Actinotignum schaalii]MDY5130206.1 hypothetical protein [Actinotignum timonense]MDY5144343.1 hypothetical protein [Actinotignum timonense]